MCRPTHHDDAPATTAPTPPAAFAGGHIAGLDGLRGGAVVVVVAYHLGLLRGGYLGVDVFFVLSGFLITSLLLAEVEGTGRVSLRRFWQRRIRRLVPAVLVLVPSVLVAAMVLEWPRTRFGDTSLDAFSTLTWWANWHQAIGGETYWDAETPNLFRHAWSLSIEEQFYVIWPLVLIAAAAAARRRGRSVRAAVGATAAVAFVASASWLVLLSHRLGDAELSRAYLGTDTRVLAPLAGCVLACWWSGRHDRSGRSTLPRGLLIAGAVAATTVLVTMVAAAGVAEPAMYRAGGFVVAALAATGLVLAVIAAGVGAPGQSPATRWTTTSVARYLGLRSYGIYLWSWPTQVLAERRFETAPRWSIILAVVILSLVFAEGSFRLVEDPIRRGRGWATRPVVRRPAWALGFAVPVVTLLLAALQAAPPPAHEQVSATDSAETALRDPPPNGGESSANGRAPGDDDQGASDDDEGDDHEGEGRASTDEGGTPSPEAAPESQRVMLMGDSVAFSAAYHQSRSLQPPPDPIASIDSRAIIGCDLLAAAGWERPQPDGTWATPMDGACDDQGQAEDVGLAGRPDVVMVMPGAWEYRAARSPEGRVLESRSPEMANELVANLVERAVRVDEAGAEFVVVEWSCPGSETGWERRDPDYVSWINDILAEVVDVAVREHDVDAWMLTATDRVCVDADPLGEPTEERIAATGDEVHAIDVAGARWFWSDWISPAMAERFSD